MAIVNYLFLKFLNFSISFKFKLKFKLHLKYFLIN